MFIRPQQKPAIKYPENVFTTNKQVKLHKTFLYFD